MTRAVLTPPPSKPTPPITETYSGPIPIAHVTVTGNIRKTFNPAQMKELTANVARVGVLEPILVRPHEGGYALIAGERRLRAAKEAGLKEIPARVLLADEQQAAEIQAFENLHRANLTPIEEAFAFKTLLTTAQVTAEQLAQRVDKSVAYVYRAVRLLELSDRVIEAIEAGTLTPAHGHQILRLPSDQRKEAEDYAFGDNWRGVQTAKDLAEWVDAQMTNSLDTAKFPKDKPYADAIACTGCMYNSGNQGQLFDGATKGQCTNSPCFEKKASTWRATKLEQIRKKHCSEAGTVIEAKVGLWEGREIGGYTVKGPLPKDHKCKADQAVIVEGRDLVTYLGVKVKKTKTKTAAGPTTTTPTADPKTRFIEEKVNEALAKAVVAASKKLGKPHLQYLLEHAIDAQVGLTESEFVEKITGVGLEIGNMSETELSQALVLLTIIDYNCDVNVDYAKDIGVDVMGVIKKARAEAEKSYTAAVPTTEKAKAKK